MTLGKRRRTAFLKTKRRKAAKTRISGIFRKALNIKALDGKGIPDTS